MTNTALNTKIDEVENKVPDHAKYVSTPEFIKVAGKVFNTKLKEANLATKSDLNAVSQRANKNEEI